jgi:hypothetical protein
VCERIEELTALYEKTPPSLSPAIEAGILAAIARMEEAELTVGPGTPADESPLCSR